MIKPKAIKPSDGKWIDGAFICKEDLSKIPVEEWDNLHIRITLSDLGNRGNFFLENTKTGKVYRFKNSKLEVWKK